MGWRGPANFVSYFGSPKIRLWIVKTRFPYWKWFHESQHSSNKPTELGKVQENDPVYDVHQLRHNWNGNLTICQTSRTTVVFGAFVPNAYGPTFVLWKSNDAIKINRHSRNSPRLDNAKCWTKIRYLRRPSWGVLVSKKSQYMDLPDGLLRTIGQSDTPP